MKVWILTSEYNDYDQHGEYFINAYKEKPTFEDLAKELELDPEFHTETLEHILRGGGRQGVEHIWYYLICKDL